jgi:hypothetical protein
VSLGLGGDTGKHGTLNTYTHGHCRCEPCTKAAREYARDIRRQRRDREAPEYVHGTADGYRNWTCRCDRCRAAHAADIRAYRARRRAEVQP